MQNSIKRLQTILVNFKMKFVLLIILVIIGTINCVDLQPSEVQCLKNIATKANDVGLINANISTICLTPGSSEILTWDDFNCFPFLIRQTLYNSTLSTDFLYTKNPSIREITLNSGSNLNTIDQEVIKLNILYMEGMKTGSTLKASFLKNIGNFKMSKGLITFEVDQNQTGSILTTLSINSNSLSNFSSIPSLRDFSFTFGDSFDISTLENLKSFKALSTLALIGPTAGSLIISDIFELLAPVSNTLFRLEVGGKIQFLKTVEQINLSNFTSLKYISLGGLKTFDYNGLFPFSALPTQLILYIYRGNFPLPDFKLFENSTLVKIINSNITTPFPTSQFKNQNPEISITNSSLKGEIDNSWCGRKFTVSSNLLGGVIPDCFFCYLNISSVAFLFSGNQFTNYNKKIDNCGYSEIQVYNLTLKSEYTFILNGKNLGLSSNLISSQNNISFMNDAPGAPISVYINSFVPTNLLEFELKFKVPGINFTVSIPPRPPKISGVYQYNSTISIYGTLFTFDMSATNVSVGGIECKLNYTSTSYIKCDIPYPVTLGGIQNVILNVYHYTANVSALIKQTDLPCNPNNCNGNGICDPFYGVCNCFYGWLTIGNDTVCKVANHSISSTSQVFSDTGGIVTLYGFFGTIHQDPQLLVNSEWFNIISIDNSSIKISIPPSIGGGLTNITFIQNNISWSGTFSIYRDKLLCPNNCGGPMQGICSFLTGECTCENNFIGFDCQPSPKGDIPSSTVKIGSTGSTTIKNEQTEFQISISSIVEVDFNGNEIKDSLIELQGNWAINKDNNKSIFNKTIETTTFILTIEEIIENDKFFKFAGNQFTVKKGGIKISLSISNWNYQNNLNTLRVKMFSDIIFDNKDINTCNNNNSPSSIESSSSSNINSLDINYIKFSLGGKVLQGRFQNKMLSDGRSTTTLTKLISKNENQIIIGLELPHCTECLLDPDFSVLVSPNFNSSSSCTPKGNGRPWLIPVAVVVPIVGVTIIAAFIIIILKNNSTKLKIFMKGIAMKKY
ncbi:hypothetical protein ACTFIV_005243 [Dictyostelium citrinum]